MFDRQRAVSEIRNALAGPADWAGVFQVAAPAHLHPLERLWHKIVLANAIADETRFRGLEFMLGAGSADLLRAMQVNVRRWSGRAQQEYRCQTRRFWALRYAARHAYGKHLPPPGQLRRSWLGRDGHQLLHQFLRPRREGGALAGCHLIDRPDLFSAG